jgi:hypothetical protein
VSPAAIERFVTDWQMTDEPHPSSRIPADREDIEEDEDLEEDLDSPEDEDAGDENDWRQTGG